MWEPREADTKRSRFVNIFIYVGNESLSPSLDELPQFRRTAPPVGMILTVGNGFMKKSNLPPVNSHHELENNNNNTNNNNNNNSG